MSWYKDIRVFFSFLNFKDEEDEKGIQGRGTGRGQVAAVCFPVFREWGYIGPCEENTGSSWDGLDWGLIMDANCWKLCICFVGSFTWLHQLYETFLDLWLAKWIILS